MDHTQLSLETLGFPFWAPCIVNTIFSTGTGSEAGLNSAGSSAVHVSCREVDIVLMVLGDRSVLPIADLCSVYPLPYIEDV